MINAAAFADAATRVSLSPTPYAPSVGGGSRRALRQRRRRLRSVTRPRIAVPAQATLWGAR
jgi:hypothetical protein